MTKQTLPTNFKDDILNESMGGKRRYKQSSNNDGTITLTDASEYDVVGDSFGAAQINATNEAVNESADKNTIIDKLSDVAANMTGGKIAGALALKELNNNMGGLQFAKDIDGKWGYIPPESESQGADAVIPFKSITADSIVDSGGMSDGQNSSTDYSATEDCYICAFMSAGNMNTSQYTQTINGGTLLHTKTFGTNPKVTIGFVYLKKGEKITIRSNGSYQNTAHSEVAYLVLEL